MAIQITETLELPFETVEGNKTTYKTVDPKSLVTATRKASQGKKHAMGLKKEACDRKNTKTTQKAVNSANNQRKREQAIIKHNPDLAKKLGLI